MNPNDSSTDPRLSMDHRLDHILQAFAAAPVPTGLQQRIAAAVAQRTAVTADPIPSRLTRLLALQPRFAIAAVSVALIAALLFVFAHPHQQQLVQQTQPQTIAQPESPTLLATAQPPSRHTVFQQPAAVTPAQPSISDLDAIALAETLAPSRPAPPLPLTSQEALLLRSTRPGQPIEVAELDTLRETALTLVAANRERASLREYIHGLLGPLATAQTLTPSSPLDEPAPVAEQPLPPPAQ